MPREYNEAKKEANRRWDEKNLDRVSVVLPKGTKELLQAEAKKQDTSVNGLINKAIADYMSRAK